MAMFKKKDQKVQEIPTLPEEEQTQTKKPLISQDIEKLEQENQALRQNLQLINPEALILIGIREELHSISQRLLDGNKLFAVANEIEVEENDK